MNISIEDCITVQVKKIIKLPIKQHTVMNVRLQDIHDIGMIDHLMTYYIVLHAN